MNLEFIESGPALLVRNTRDVLVIADLHLGIESDLARHGIHFKSRSRERQKKAVACIRETAPDCVLLLGDVKHSIPQTTRQEYRELPAMLSAFRDLAQLMVMPGNHDIGIERFLNDGELLPKEGALVDGTGYLHGHTYPDPLLENHLIICGHHHPLVCLRDEVGCSLRAPAYLFAKINEDCFRNKGSHNQVRINHNEAASNDTAPSIHLVREQKIRRKQKVTKVPPPGPGREVPEGVMDPCRISHEGMEWPECPDENGPGERSGTRVLFMPAFNELSGFDVLKIVGSPTTPLSRSLNRESCEIFLTDGTCIGPLSSVEDK